MAQLSQSERCWLGVQAFRDTGALELPFMAGKAWRTDQCGAAIALLSTTRFPCPRAGHCLAFPSKGRQARPLSLPTQRGSLCLGSLAASLQAPVLPSRSAAWPPEGTGRGQ